MYATSSSSLSSCTSFALSPPQSVSTSRRPSPNRRREEEEKEDESLKELSEKMQQYSSISSSRVKSSSAPYSTTIDETEVESNIYFPTFARRGSSPGRQQDPRRPSVTSKIQRPTISTKESKEAEDRLQDKDGETIKEVDHDEMFELDDGDDDLNPYPLDLIYSFQPQQSVESVRRASDQSTSSTSTKDLNMVWDEEDVDSDDAELESIQSPPNNTTLIRQNSVTSKFARSPTSPKWSSSSLQQPTAIPSLPFVRKVRRPSENNSNVSPSSYKWQMINGTNTTALSRNNSNAKPLDVSQRCQSYDRLKLASPPLRAQVTTMSSPNSPRVGEEAATATTTTANRSRSSTVASPSPLVNGEVALQKQQQQQLNVAGRKRSNTDPFAGRWIQDGHYNQADVQRPTAEEVNKLLDDPRTHSHSSSPSRKPSPLHRPIPLHAI